MINIRIAGSKMCNGDNSIFVSFPYNEKVIDIIRSFPSKYWDKKDKEWELPFNKLGELVNQLSTFDIDITGEYISLEKKEVEKPVGFEFKTKPFGHQVEGFQYGLKIICGCRHVASRECYGISI